eukprot:6176861-Pleurochrysis_carterae.AAC.2
MTLSEREHSKPSAPAIDTFALLLPGALLAHGTPTGALPSARARRSNFELVRLALGSAHNKCHTVFVSLVPLNAFLNTFPDSRHDVDATLHNDNYSRDANVS